ncbi:MAG: hypothetical protein AAFV45_09150 [Pseudomonadota bacterium]
MTSDGYAPDNDVLAAPMNALLRHPKFDAAALSYVENVIEWRKGLGRFNRVGTNLGFHIINYTMYLDFAGRTGANDHGATYSALLEICENRGQCGSRALRTILALLSVLGHLQTDQSRSDKRIRAYVPSQRLVREATDIYSYAMGVIDELKPGTGYRRTIESDPQFLWHIISTSGRAIIEDDVRITEHFPQLHDIISRAGGLPTSISLAHAQMLNLPSPPSREIARSFSISVSQVRAVMNALDDAELIIRAPDGTIEDASRLVAEHKGLIARELALHVKYALGLEHHFLAAAA